MALARGCKSMVKKESRRLPENFPVFCKKQAF
jgi:hypothetical protein